LTAPDVAPSVDDTNVFDVGVESCAVDELLVLEEDVADLRGVGVVGDVEFVVKSLPDVDFAVEGVDDGEVVAVGVAEPVALDPWV
jgi:hypothetical protein